MTPTIFQMQEQFQERLDGIEASYEVYSGTFVGDKKVAGKHLTIYYPKDLTLSRETVNEINRLVETYFGPVVRVVRKLGVINDAVRSIEFHFD